MSSHPTITPLPPAPQRTDSPTVFSDKADVFVAALAQFQSEANTQADFNNTKAGQTQTNAENAAISAANASSSEIAAVGAANYVGPWSGLSGALNIPASTSHNGAIWILLENVATVQSEQPGVSNKWLMVVTEDVLLRANNLSDLPSASAARNNLGLGIAARVDTALSLRNKIINGNFDFWQRGTSLTAATAVRYLADRWLTDAAGNTTILPSRIDFSPGHILENNNPRFAHRAIVAAGTAGANNRAILIQRIEGVRTLAGRTVTLTFWGRADIARSVAIEFAQVFGTGGSPSTAVTGIGAQKVTLPGSDFTKFSVTVAIPSILGKTIGTNGDDSLQLLIWFSAGSNFNARTDTLGEQSGTFDIAQVQLEEGSIATPFEQRPIALELALCQRYYEVANTTTATSVAADRALPMVFWKVTKRSVPTVSATFNTGTGATYNVSGTTSFAFQATTHSAQATASITADAEL